MREQARGHRYPKVHIDCALTTSLHLKTRHVSEYKHIRRARNLDAVSPRLLNKRSMAVRQDQTTSNSLAGSCRRRCARRQCHLREARRLRQWPPSSKHDRALGPIGEKWKCKQIDFGHCEFRGSDMMEKNWRRCKAFADAEEYFGVDLRIWFNRSKNFPVACTISQYEQDIEREFQSEM